MSLGLDREQRLEKMTRQMEMYKSLLEESILLNARYVKALEVCKKQRDDMARTPRVPIDNNKRWLEMNRELEKILSDKLSDKEVTQ